MELKRCADCGNYFEKLLIHHQDRNHQNNEYSNLVEVCKRCHGRIHGFERAEALMEIKSFDTVNEFQRPIGYRLAEGFRMLEGEDY